LHVPAGYDGSTPRPLVFALHQFTDTGRGMQRLTGFDAIADRERFFVVYPDGIFRTWNAGRGSDVDDVGFIETLADQIQQDFNIDPTRIYATGASAGGMMAQYLACHSGLFAAIAPVMGSMTEANVQECASTGLPVLIIHGTADPVVPFEGGDTFAGPGNRVRFLSAPDNAAFWAERNECGAEPIRTPLPDSVPDDETKVVQVTFPACAPGQEVVLYEVEGGGHTWPGSNNRYPAFIVGRASREINASEVIWEFFSAHARP
ncbi:MAG: prolyl oligopeptidase family serine peptidase, partial [Candidatus Hydrogenedentes bacterium]|nr:prolyl oligopeptidase family serine peptidase [Candidatus Hydrogenedentota bacterium]